MHLSIEQVESSLCVAPLESARDSYVSTVALVKKTRPT